MKIFGTCQVEFHARSAAEEEGVHNDALNGRRLLCSRLGLSDRVTSADLGIVLVHSLTVVLVSQQQKVQMALKLALGLRILTTQLEVCMISDRLITAVGGSKVLTGLKRATFRFMPIRALSTGLTLSLALALVNW